jgi:signal transduction histidine kinase
MVPLASSKLCSQIPPAEVARLQAVAREMTFPHGQTIFKEGDDGDGIYIIKSGKVLIYALVGNGERRPISSVSDGEMFGEMAIIDHERRSATVATDGETTVFFISRENMLDLLDHSPALSRNLVREISRRLREFNRQYIREVIQAERLGLVGRFARSIVHDLKNPLNIIGIAADMSVSDIATPEMRQSSRQRIRKQVDRISTMVNELLEFSRTSQTSMVLSNIDYSAFVQGLVEEIRNEASVKNVTVELDNPPPPVRIAASPPRLSRVFYNLVHNAIEAMGGGNGKIVLRFRVEKQAIITEIQDSGPGIPEEVQPHLFEPFFTHGKAQGTGLGLSICQRIVEDHQGSIHALNSPNGGAIFSFSLPIQGV